MRPQIVILLFILSLVSCKSARKTTIVTKKEQPKKLVTTKPSPTDISISKANDIVDYAKSFNGVRYKYGGTTKKGMDCSGLVYVSFQKENIALPRVSRDMAKEGGRIKLNEARKGDLLFFQTNKNRKIINHVGLVISKKNEPIQFIHSTTSKGVLISSFSEPYWKSAFIEARRIL